MGKKLGEAKMKADDDTPVSQTGPASPDLQATVDKLQIELDGAKAELKTERLKRAEMEIKKLEMEGTASSANSSQSERVKDLEKSLEEYKVHMDELEQKVKSERRGCELVNAELEQVKTQLSKKDLTLTLIGGEDSALKEG